MNRLPQPLSRVKGGVHAVSSYCFAGFIVLVAAASAAELKIKVVDPQSAAVAGAQVELFRGDNVDPRSYPDHLARRAGCFSPIEAVALIAFAYWLPGFAAQTTDVASSDAEPATVKLRLAPAAETVTVSATRTPVPTNAAGADVETLSSGQLEVMRPVAADDALHFLPGAVVGTAGQRGGLSSLFVRGGDSPTTKSSSTTFR